MDTCLNIGVIMLLLLLPSTVNAQYSVIDVTKYGAKSNGDLSQVYPCHTYVRSVYIYYILKYSCWSWTGFDKSLEWCMRSRKTNQSFCSESDLLLRGTDFKRSLQRSCWTSGSGHHKGTSRPQEVEGYLVRYSKCRSLHFVRQWDFRWARKFGLEAK